MTLGVLVFVSHPLPRFLDLSSISSLDTFDPSRSHANLDISEADAKELVSDGWLEIEKILDQSAVLFSFEQIGGAEAAMNMAKDYAQGRYAFGRSIASFQAIKHKVADMYISLQLAPRPFSPANSPGQNGDLLLYFQLVNLNPQDPKIEKC